MTEPSPRRGQLSIRMSRSEFATFSLAARRTRQSLGAFLREGAHEAAGDVLEPAELAPLDERTRNRPGRPRKR